MYILGFRSSWGTSRVCPAWSPSGHILTQALSPFWGAPVGSHACPEDAVYSFNDSCSNFTNVFSVWVLLTNVQRISYYNSCTADIHIIHHIHMYTYTYTTHHIHTSTCIFISSFLLLFVAGWLPSALCVQYTPCHPTWDFVTNSFGYIPWRRLS